MKLKRDIDKEFQAEIRKLPCIACGKSPPSTVSHIKTRGSGGDDSAHNIIPMCLDCHRAWEGKRYDFLLKHPHLHKHLLDLGWEIWEFQGKIHITHPQNQ